MSFNTYQASIDAELQRLTPKGDFVLVEPIKEDSGALWIPGRVMTRSGNWTDRNRAGLKRGRVVAVGQGDRLFSYFCPDCMDRWNELDPTGNGGVYYPFPQRLEGKTSRCRLCGAAMELAINPATGEPYVDRAPMHVAVGDEVIYTRAEANVVVLNEKEYVFLHEEQHILAVVEREESTCSTEI